MRSKISLMGFALIVAAILLLLCGFVCMFSIGDKMQYVLPAATISEKEDELTQTYEQVQRLLVDMGEMLDTPAVATRAQGQRIQHTRNGECVDTTVYAVGEGFFDLEHSRLLDGRLISSYDIANAQQVLILSSDAAIKMFQSESPVGQKVVFGDKLYRVIGVVKGGRHIGEKDECRTYVPITAANGIKMNTLEIAANGSNILTSAVFENTLTAWNSSGTFYCFEKLKMRAWLPLRWVLVLVAVRLALGIGVGIMCFVKESIRVYRERLTHSYASKLIPAMFGRGILVILICAVFAMIVYSIALAATRPLYVFGEWIPDVFVNLSSLMETFWNLNDMNTAGVRYMSKDACFLELVQGLIRWGTGCLLMGLTVIQSWQKKENVNVTHYGPTQKVQGMKWQKAKDVCWNDQKQDLT